MTTFAAISWLVLAALLAPQTGERISAVPVEARLSAPGAGEVPAAPRGFAGVWKTRYGSMRLVEDGAAVRGVYDWAGGSTIAGKLVDGRFAFTYEEPDGVSGSGELVLDPDGTSFQGTWQSSGSEGGSWGGRRVDARPGHAWLVVLEAHWEDDLAAPEYSYGAMLRAFFSRLPEVQVRHRFVHDVADFERFCREVAYLPEPVVLYVSSHGTEEGVQLGDETARADDLIRALRDVPTLAMLHFGSCLVLNGDIPARIHAARPPSGRFPISGFTRTADWGGSAIVDFTYLELVLGRGLAPREALGQTRALVSFAGESGDGPIAGSGLALVEPPASAGAAAPAPGEAALAPTAR